MIYDLAKDLKEKESLANEKEKLENINKENISLINSFKEKIQELNFAKSTLTKMLADKEGIINTLTGEKAELLDQINSLKEDKNVLNEHIKIRIRY